MEPVEKPYAERSKAALIGEFDTSASSLLSLACAAEQADLGNVTCDSTSFEFGLTHPDDLLNESLLGKHGSNIQVDFSFIVVAHSRN